MQDYALLNTCCIFKYERFCNLQCLLHLNFWIYFLKNMVLHMKMCKSLHIAHFEYATVQYIVPHFGSLFCTLWIFQCAKSCTLQCNISKVPILTLYAIFWFELFLFESKWGMYKIVPCRPYSASRSCFTHTHIIGWVILFYCWIFKMYSTIIDISSRLSLCVCI